MKFQFVRCTVIAFTLCGFTAAAACAQEPSPSAAPANPLMQFVTRFENNMLALAEAMPADKFNFAPAKETFAPGSPQDFATVRTFAQQITHVSGEPFRLLAPFGVKPDADVDVKSFDSLTSKDDIIKALKASFDYQNKVIAAMTPENAFVPEGPRGANRVSALMGILNDDGDHYGQMVEYLRMNGIIPPSTAKQTRSMPAAPAQK